jgi:hypothetical protein
MKTSDLPPSKDYHRHTVIDGFCFVCCSYSPPPLFAYLVFNKEESKNVFAGLFAKAKVIKKIF